MVQRKSGNNAFIIFLSTVVVANLVFFLYGKTERETLLSSFDINKPTVILLIGEHECITCVAKASSLAELYHEVKRQGVFELLGIVLSEEGKDSKSIRSHFDFPFFVSSDFGALARLNLNKTPVLMVVDSQRRVLYSELILSEGDIDVAHLTNVIMQKLYFSLDG